MAQPPVDLEIWTRRQKNQDLGTLIWCCSYTASLQTICIDDIFNGKVIKIRYEWDGPCSRKQTLKHRLHIRFIAFIALLILHSYALGIFAVGAG